MSRIGVVAALPRELAPFRAAGRAGEGDLRPLAGGIGPERAARAAERLCADGAVGLCSFGFAGALDGHCRSGDLLLPVSVFRESGTVLLTDPDWRTRLAVCLQARVTVHSGSQIESEVTLRDRDAKARAARTGALGVDQESVAIAIVAQRQAVPFVAVRAVCDDAGTELPWAALAAVDANGRLRPWRLCRAVVRRPWELVGLAGLRRASTRALRTLAEVVRIAGPDLAFASTDSGDR